MYLNEPPRTVLTHIAFHLPVVPMETMPLVEPGAELPSASGARIQPLGEPPKDNQVAWSCSYRIDVLGGPRILVVAPNLTAAQVADEPVDVAIVCPYAPELLAIVQKARPELVVLDDTFLPANHPERRRIALADLHLLQEALRPAKSVVLAPGESWTVPATASKR